MCLTEVGWRDISGSQPMQCFWVKKSSPSVEQGVGRNATPKK